MNAYEAMISKDSCLAQCKEDEPVFVLCARDPLCSVLLVIWAMLSAALGLHRADKIVSAYRVRDDVDRWRLINADRLTPTKGSLL